VLGFSDYASDPKILSGRLGGFAGFAHLFPRFIFPALDRYVDDLAASIRDAICCWRIQRWSPRRSRASTSESGGPRSACFRVSSRPRTRRRPRLASRWGRDTRGG
jgi:hypothetical protein